MIFKNDKIYDIIKYCVLIVLPACAVLYHSLGDVWAFPYVDEVVKTINAVTLFLGALTGVSAARYNKELKG